MKRANISASFVCSSLGSFLINPPLLPLASFRLHLSASPSYFPSKRFASEALLPIESLVSTHDGLMFQDILLPTPPLLWNLINSLIQF